MLWNHDPPSLSQMKQAVLSRTSYSHASFQPEFQIEAMGGYRCARSHLGASLAQMPNPDLYQGPLFAWTSLAPLPHPFHVTALGLPLLPSAELLCLPPSPAASLCLDAVPSFTFKT